MRGALTSTQDGGPFSQLGSSLSYSDADDFLQYLLTLPPGWSESTPTNMQSPINRESPFVGPVVPITELDGQQSVYHCEPSPRAVENVAAMITDRVS